MKMGLSFLKIIREIFTSRSPDVIPAEEEDKYIIPPEIEYTKGLIYLKANILYVKTPKCASTSLQSALVEYCENNSLSFVKWNPDTELPQRSIPIRASLGHIPYRPNFLKPIIDIFEEDLPLFTIASIRDPFARMQSHFNFLDSRWNKRLKVFESANPRDLVQGKTEIPRWNGGLFNNFIAYYLGFDSLKSITKSSLKNRFNHIQIAEHWDTGLKRLSSLLSYDLVSYNHQKGHGLTPKHSTTQGFEKLFKSHNQLDYKIYDLCTDIYLS